MNERICFHSRGVCCKHSRVTWGDNNRMHCVKFLEKIIQKHANTATFEKLNSIQCRSIFFNYFYTNVSKQYDDHARITKHLVFGTEHVILSFNLRLKNYKFKLCIFAV
jgi:hypothetical protein